MTYKKSGYCAPGLEWVAAEGSTKHSHYDYEYRGIKIDPYRIFEIYQISNAAQQHAIKKLLRAGKGEKPLGKDIREAIDSLNRWLEMIEEDEKD